MSIHIEAKPGDIAEAILLPGDPMRAKWIAHTFLENPVCFNRIRGMFGYTGTFRGTRVSVMGTGMGIPSALIYAEELINEYGVKKLIRVGSAGSYQKEINLRDVVIAMAASTNSSLNDHRFMNGTFAPTADFKLFSKAIEYAKQNQIPVKAGNILSSDYFYHDNPEHYKQWAAFGVLGVEMETAALYTVAAKNQVQALAILTISDSLVTGEETTAEEREKSFSKMVEIALNIIDE